MGPEWGYVAAWLAARRGFAAECAQADHDDCRAGDCACACHLASPDCFDCGSPAGEPHKSWCWKVVR
jgi:hypothetical protein